MVYAYFRCSTDSQMERNGFQMQKDVVYKYCKQNNITIEDEFCDEGISGTKEEREGLYDLLATMENGDKVIVQNTSRLWRDEYVKVFVHKELRKLNADIISVESPNYTIYEKDPSAFLFNSIMEAFDQYERMSIASKLHKGRIAKAKSGRKSCGTAPIGYKWNKGEIVPDEKTADIVRDIFNQYISLGSLSAVSRYCNAVGYMTNTGKQFSKMSLSRLLRNDIYVGMITFGNIKTNGTHEPLVSVETFNKVKEILG